MDKNKTCGFNNVHVGIITSYGDRLCWGKQRFILVVPAFYPDMAKAFITVN